jgi:DNA-binding transcriptional MerR regulator
LTLESTPRFTVVGVTTRTPTGLRVAELAAAVGVRGDTIRYYERAGLLPAPPRSPAGYRHYPASAVDRVRFIQGCARLGLRLNEIADLLAVRDTGTCPCEPAAELLRRRINELDAEHARLSALRADLVAMADSLPAVSCPEPTPGTWLPDQSEPDARR